jgi:hypothetical protein
MATLPERLADLGQTVFKKVLATMLFAAHAAPFLDARSSRKLPIWVSRDSML